MGHDLVRGCTTIEKGDLSGTSPRIRHLHVLVRKNEQIQQLQE